MSHVSWFCSVLVLISFVYICLNCVFFREEAELPSRPPTPSPLAEEALGGVEKTLCEAEETLCYNAPPPGYVMVEQMSL